MDWGRKWLVDFNAGKTQLDSFDQSDNTGAIDVKMDGSVLEEKSSFKMLGLTFSSKLDWGSYIISIAKSASKKIGALIRSMKFLSAEVALFRYKSTIRPCLSFFYRYYFGRCSSGLAELVSLLYSRRRSTRYSDRLHDFPVTIPRCYEDIYVNSFFPRTARLCNSLPIECFSLTDYLSGFKSRINRYLLTVDSL